MPNMPKYKIQTLYRLSFYSLQQDLNLFIPLIVNYEYISFLYNLELKFLVN